MLDWNFFKEKFEGKERYAFQNLAYFLFCEETNQKHGIFEYKDQWGIETEPVEYQGKIVGFQAKYYTTRISDNKQDIIASIDDAKKKNDNLELFFLYLNDSFKESSLPDKKKPKFQIELENHAESLGIEIVWRVPSNMDIMLNKPEYSYIRNYFFDDWETPQSIVERLNRFNKDLMNYPSTTNDEEYHRPQQDELESFVESDDEENIALLAGDAGMGKTVLTKQMLAWLCNKKIPTLAIKADYNQFSSIEGLEKILDIPYGLLNTMKYLAKAFGKIVVIIDQIDALSLTLSKDRSGLQLYKNLINLLSQIDGLRIIVSCREYDLNYDTFLQPLDKHNKIRIGKLDNSQVKTVVESIGVNYDNLNDFTKDLVSVPLHLSIFCDVYIQSPDFNVNFTSLNDLYDRLWAKYVNEKVSKIDTVELQKALMDISYKMYDDQELSVEAKIIGDNHGRALAYFESAGLIKRTPSNRIRFFHQSFFDYVYARSYVNEGRHLYEDIQMQHQGFFIRARVKQVLEYLRSADPTEYKNNIKNILKSDDYKLHLKYLVLDTITFQLHPNDDERMIFKKLIKPNKLYYNNFISNIWSGDWLNYLLESGCIKELFDASDDKLIGKLPSFAWRRPIDRAIINLLDFVKGSDYQNKYKLIADILCNVSHLNIEEYNQCFNETYEKWESANVYHYLRGVSKKNPSFVVALLKKETEKYYKDFKRENFRREYVPDRNDFYSIAEKMSENNKNEWTDFLMWFVEFVAKHTLMSIHDNKELDDSWAFYLYSPNGSYRSADEIDSYYSALYHNLNEIAIGEPKRISEYLRNCRDSNVSCLVVLAVMAYMKNVDVFIDDIKEVLTNPNNYDGSSWLTYNMINLLKDSFMKLDAATQDEVCDVLYNLHPKWETLVMKDGDRIFHSKAYGEAAYKYMKAIPEAYIKKSKLNALFVEYSHKFGEIKNEPPKGTEVHVGWSSLPAAAYENMSLKDLKHSFLEITSDQTYHDWDRPTLTGHAMAFGQYVEKDWYKYKDLIDEISSDSKYPILYSIYACQGLCKAKTDAGFIAKIAENIIRRTEKFEDRSILFLNSLEYVIDNGALTDSIFDYLYEIACDKTSEYSNEDEQFKDKGFIETFSFHKRGLAAAYLIECYDYKQYADMIFDAMFKIAEDGNLSTRVAVVHYMAYLQNIDTKRNVELFYALQKETMQKLVQIPISDMHPLLYMIVSDFDALKPYFESVMNIPEAGRQLKVILLIAWLKGYDGAEELLKQAMAANNCGLKDVFRQAVESLKISKMQDKAFQFIMRCLDIQDEELGKSIDVYVDDIAEHLKENKAYVDAFIDKYIESDLSRYQRRVLYDYLKEKAGDEPEKTLERLHKLQDNICTDDENSYFREDNVFEILVRAYNSIYKFDKEDELLDDAIDLFDDILKSGNLGHRAFNFLNDLEK